MHEEQWKWMIQWQSNFRHEFWNFTRWTQHHFMRNTNIIKKKELFKNRSRSLFVSSVKTDIKQDLTKTKPATTMTNSMSMNKGYWKPKLTAEYTCSTDSISLVGKQKKFNTFLDRTLIISRSSILQNQQNKWSFEIFQFHTQHNLSFLGLSKISVSLRNEQEIWMFRALCVYFCWVFTGTIINDVSSDIAASRNKA